MRLETNELLTRSAVQLASLIREGQLSAQELTEASLRTLGPQFCAARMLGEYLHGPYTR